MEVVMITLHTTSDLPLRIQRFRLRMVRFDFTIAHGPGKLLAIADTLSRAPINILTEADQELIEKNRLLCTCYYRLSTCFRRMTPRDKMPAKS